MHFHTRRLKVVGALRKAAREWCDALFTFSPDHFGEICNCNVAIASAKRKITCPEPPEKRKFD